jgi:hypothetical protein
MGDPVREELAKRDITEQLPCAVAFDIAEALGVSPEEIGRAADRLAVRLTKCQLGLFGYSPQKRIVKASTMVDPEVKKAILDALQGGRLPCIEAWRIAGSFGHHKLKIAGFCDGLNVKIGPCQLGAF